MSDTGNKKLYDAIPLEMSIDGVIGFAIRSERETLRFFNLVSKKLADDSSAKLLEELISSELDFYEKLKQSFQSKFPEGFKLALERIKQGTIGYQSIEKRKARVVELGLMEVITLTIREERKVMELYESALENRLPYKLQKLINSILKLMEQHIKSLKKNLNRCNDIWDI